jgi:predicted transcriptional regulator
MTRWTRPARFGVAALAAVVILAAIAAFLPGSASAAPAQRPTAYDVSTSNDTVLKVYTDCDFSVLDSGDSAPFVVQVKDRRNIPIEGARVTVQVVGTGNVAGATAITDADGFARFTYASSRVERESEAWIVVRAEKDGYSGGYANLGIATIPKTYVSEAGDFWYAAFGFLSVGAIFSTELGRYGVARLFFPLYTRLKKDEVLEHFVRGQIYGFIVSNPGEHYSMIKDSLNVNNGTLSHHLRTLEVQGFIKSRRDGSYRRFYPVKMNIPQDEGQKLSDLQLSILDIVRQTGYEGASQRFIADMLDASQQTISYNLRALSRNGVVRIEHDGRRARYYIQNN